MIHTPNGGDNQQPPTIRQAALRWFMQRLPSEPQRVFALTLLLGALCGLAAVAFHLAIQAAEHVLIDRALAASGWTRIAWTLLLPTAGGLVSGIFLAHVVPDARGSGIPQVKVAYEVNGGRMPLRVVLGKFGLGVLQIGSGASLGREGPTVQICAGIASAVGRAAALSRQNLRNLLPVGAAAGIAAAFNAPIAAVTFTLEEIIGDLQHTVLAGIIVAAALAAAIEHALLGAHPVFSIPPGYGLHHSVSLLLYAALGVAAAGLAIVFCDSLLAARAWFRRLHRIPVWARPAIGGLLTGMLAAVAISALRTEGITGAGYATLAAALAGQVPLKLLLALCVMKAIATISSYSSGGAGGLFAPSLFLGGTLGGAIGFLDVQLFHHAPSEIGAFALVGMGAVFAAIIRAPITSILIIIEMTGGYDLMLPLMIANMTAYVLARRVRPLAIYEALLAQDGVRLPHGSQATPHVLDRLQVADARPSAAHTLPAHLTVADASAIVEHATASMLPVVDSDGQVVGCVTLARLRRLQAVGQGGTRLHEIAEDRPILQSDQSLLAALTLMDQSEAWELPVVDPRRQPLEIGVLTLGDLIHAQADALRQAFREDTRSAAMSEVAETVGVPAGPPLNRLSGAVTGAAADHVTYHTLIVGPASAAVGMPLRRLHLPAGVLIVLVERAGEVVVPAGNTAIAADDRLTLVAAQRHGPALAVLFAVPDAPPGSAESAFIDHEG
ncbi:MAG TPA: chloride channel protein [Herpetosiphonaceae bacterium]